MTTEHLRRARRQERRIADENGGRVTPQSGAGWSVKNDVRTPTESWEAKTTTAAQFPLKAADLNTAWEHATVDRRRMVFEVEFAGFAGLQRWVVLARDDYVELRDRAGA